MKELTDREVQWLEAFAKNHEFFASFLLHYKLKHRLSNNQYYWLSFHINQTEEKGDTPLSTDDVKFLRDKSEDNEQFRVLLDAFL